jgi:hypothetical protein
MTTDPNDWISDLLVVENPIKEAHDCGDGVTYETYARQAVGVTRGHPDFVMSGGDLSEFASCPHRWRMGYRDGETLSTEWGSLIDCILLDPNSFDRRFAVRPETYTNEKKEVKEWNGNANVCRAWKEQQNGKQIIKPDDLSVAHDAVRILRADNQIAETVDNSRKQVMLTGFYDDVDTGLRIPLRALIDLVPADSKFIADLKTCTSAAPRAWKTHVHTYGYHQQAARHLDLWNAAHGDTRNEFRHIIQESYPPFEIAKRMLAAEFLSLGRYQYVKALKRYAKSLKTDSWEGYDAPQSNADLVIDGHLVVSPESWMVMS